MVVFILFIFYLKKKQRPKDRHEKLKEKKTAKKQTKKEEKERKTPQNICFVPPKIILQSSFVVRAIRCFSLRSFIKMIKNTCKMKQTKRK